MGWARTACSDQERFSCRWRGRGFGPLLASEATLAFNFPDAKPEQSASANGPIAIGPVWCIAALKKRWPTRATELF